MKRSVPGGVDGMPMRSGLNPEYRVFDFCEFNGSGASVGDNRLLKATPLCDVAGFEGVFEESVVVADLGDDASIAWSRIDLRTYFGWIVTL
jgi:hypothetical protein